MYPAARQGWFELVVVTSAFGIVTLVTMSALVLLARAGVNFLPLTKIQHFSHAIAGATILLCGLAIVFLGL
jgi:threonine/homoserine/homoserine lactone efflux protein